MKHNTHIPDICLTCLKPFGESGEDKNGYNFTCLHCGNNSFITEEDIDNDFIHEHLEVLDYVKS